ncbi:hypothetical protein RUM44_007693 [Polyplax serrata]|uniref:HTH La-type RNA-binding domain-containing protein n=1 Tax=Polyplax serrata TaxID=468196 RepID=A0ABR1BA78_POLSC
MALPFHSVECASNDRNAKQKGKVVWSEAKKSYFRAADLVNSCHVGRKRCGLAAAEGIVIESQSTMTKWVFPGRFLFPKASDFTDMDDWPTLGQAVHTFEKKKSVVITNGETAKQNGTTQEKAGSHEDSDESQSSQINNQDTRTKKGSRHKWLPLDLDLMKLRRESQTDRRRSNLKEKQQDWYENCDTDKSDRSRDKDYKKDPSKRTSFRYTRGRGRARINTRSTAYKKSSLDYPDYPVEYMPSKLNGNLTRTPYVIPYVQVDPQMMFSDPSFQSVRVNEPTLIDYVKKQIEYYFSSENLERDFFFRRKMDSEGYIPVSLIASFPRLQALTTNHTVVIDAIRSSDKLEMNNLFKVRTKTEPTRWPILDKATQIPGNATNGPVIMIPPPPLIHTFSPLPSFLPSSPLFQQSENISKSQYENLNPNVPEFVPVNLASASDGELSDAEEVLENGDAHEFELEKMESKVESKPVGKKADVKVPSQTPAVAGADLLKKVVKKEEGTVVLSPAKQEPPAEEPWFEVKKKVKPHREKLDDESKKKATQCESEKEELDFQFDEDLQLPQGRHNTFTDWCEDDDDYELSDDQVDKILIVTQNYQSSRPPKHEGYDRTAKWMTRVKMSQELEQVINDGLYYYEEDLWLQHEQKARKKVNSAKHKVGQPMVQDLTEKVKGKKGHGETQSTPPPRLNVGHDSTFVEEVPSRNQKDVHRRHVPRFFAVVKDEVSLDENTPRKRKTKHSSNPPVEHHVGWVMDVKGHRPRTYSTGSSAGTSPNEGASSSLGSLSSFQHPSHLLLKENNFTQQVYHKYHSRCLKERKRLGLGQSQEMNTLFRFWSFFLRENFNRKMYDEFKTLAIEDSSAGFRYGLECLFRFFSYGLEKKFRPEVYQDFQVETLKDFATGQLYGMEKFWAFLKYYKHSSNLQVDPRLKRHLSKFNSVNDFRVDPPDSRGKRRNRSASESYSGDGRPQPWPAAIQKRIRRYSSGSGLGGVRRSSIESGSRSQGYDRRRANSFGSGRLTYDIQEKDKTGNKVQKEMIRSGTDSSTDSKARQDRNKNRVVAFNLTDDAATKIERKKSETEAKPETEGKGGGGGGGDDDDDGGDG